MQPRLKKSINQVHLKNGPYELIVMHLGRELELNGFEAADERQANTVSKYATNNSETPKSTCNHRIKSRYHKSQCRQLKKQNNKSRTRKPVLEEIMVHPQTLTPTPITVITIATKRMTRNL